MLYFFVIMKNIKIHIIRAIMIKLNDEIFFYAIKNHA